MPETKSLPPRAALACLVLLCLALAAAAQPQQATPQSTQTPAETPEDATTATKSFERLEWRSIGPANMGGRVADIEGVAGDPKSSTSPPPRAGSSRRRTAACAGLRSSSGRAPSPSATSRWSRATPRSSGSARASRPCATRSSFGDGVYKSTDGGRTWQHMGLRDTLHVSKILVHPRNPDVVYVGAQGHAFGPNEERGVFMTTDGGKTWNKTLYLGPEHGVADMDIDPSNPNVVYAVMWKFRRTPWGAHVGRRTRRTVSFDRRRAHVEEVGGRAAQSRRENRRRGRALEPFGRLRHHGGEGGDALALGRPRRDVAQRLEADQHRLARLLLHARPR